MAYWHGNIEKIQKKKASRAKVVYDWNINTKGDFNWRQETKGEKIRAIFEQKEILPFISVGHWNTITIAKCLSFVRTVGTADW